MHFQLDVDYYSNEANKNKYKNVQLIVLTKNNLKIATNCTGQCTCSDYLSYLLSGLQSTLLLGLGVASKYIYRTWKYIIAESYVCFSKIYVALYQYDICK